MKNNTIMTVKIVVFTIVNTIMIVTYQFINSIRLSSIVHGVEYRSRFVYFAELLPVQLINIL